MGRRHLPLLVFGAVHLVSTLPFLLDRAPGTNAAMIGFPLDDAWIHLVYARSLAAFEGFAWNPGQPESGFTSPLWAILLAPAFWIPGLSTLGLTLAVKALGLALAVVTSLLAFRVVSRLSLDTWAGWSAGLLIAAEPALTFAKLSGMEVLLAAATVLFTLDALLAERPMLAGLGLALAPLARPENAIFSALAALVLGAMLIERGQARRLWTAFSFPFVAGASWVVYNMIVIGRPLPTTFYAKHEPMTLETFSSNMRAVAGPITGQVGALAAGVALVLAVFGAALLVGRSRAASATSRRCTALFLVPPLLYVCGVAWAHDLQDPGAFYFSRYLLPPMVFVLALVGLGAVAALRWAWPRGLPARIGATAMAALPITGIVAVLPATTARFAWNCQNIQELNVATAQWVAAHSTSDDWVGTVDAGAVRFFGTAKVLDLAALNSHELLVGRARDHVDRVQARFLVLFPALLDTAVDDYVKVHSVTTHSYTICRCDQAELAVYERAQTTRNSPEAPPPTQ